MIIINIKCGLGNQMYQYALYRALKHAGKDVKLCLYHFENTWQGKSAHIPAHGTRFLLPEIFETEYDRADDRESCRLGDIRMDPFSRLLRKLGVSKKTHIREESREHWTLEDLTAMDSVFLDGYWQDFSFQKGIEEEIRGAFRFRRPLSGKNLDAARQIRSSNSVSVHIRRNDYLKTTMYEILDRDYYREAMAQIEKVCTDPVYFCFSDDIRWCRENLEVQNRKIVYVDWNQGSDSYMDMQLMSLCSHNIVANSTFSIWGAWLNANPDKLVIRPRYYFAAHDPTGDFPWPEGWIPAGRS